jgi:hypothetical protein
MSVANALQERHPVLFNRYLFEPAINLLLRAARGGSGNKVGAILGDVVRT